LSDVTNAFDFMSQSLQPASPGTHSSTHAAAAHFPPKQPSGHVSVFHVRVPEATTHLDRSFHAEHVSTTPPTHATSTAGIEVPAGAALDDEAGGASTVADTGLPGSTAELLHARKAMPIAGAKTRFMADSRVSPCSSHWGRARSMTDPATATGVSRHAPRVRERARLVPGSRGD
jgi:hypothetical protein